MLIHALKNCYSAVDDALFFDSQDSIPSCRPVMPQARQLLEFKANVAPLVVAELRAEDRQHLESRHRGRLADISSKHCQGMLKLISSHKVGITWFQSIQSYDGLCRQPEKDESQLALVKYSVAHALDLTR